MTTDERTNDPTPAQIVADAITEYWQDEERSGPNRGPVGHDAECGKAAVAALCAAGMLAGAPTPEQIEAAAEALFDESQELDQENSWGDNLPDEWREAWRNAARAALVAAAGAAPQEPSGARTRTDETKERTVGAWITLRAPAVHSCGYSAP